MSGKERSAAEGSRLPGGWMDADAACSQHPPCSQGTGWGEVEQGGVSS